VLWTATAASAGQEAPHGVEPRRWAQETHLARLNDAKDVDGLRDYAERADYAADLRTKARDLASKRLAEALWERARAVRSMASWRDVQLRGSKDPATVKAAAEGFGRARTEYLARERAAGRAEAASAFQTLAEGEELELAKTTLKLRTDEIPHLAPLLELVLHERPDDRSVLKRGRVSDEEQGVSTSCPLEAARALSRHSDGLDVVLSGLRHPRREIRSLCAEALASRSSRTEADRSRAVVSLCGSFLVEPTPSVRRMILASIDTYRVESVLALRFVAVALKDEDSAVADFAAERLASLDGTSPEASRALEAYALRRLETGDAAAAKRAIETLGRIGDRETTTFLESASTRFGGLVAGGEALRRVFDDARRRIAEGRKDR
jgi:hypothetical protein